MLFKKPSRLISVDILRILAMLMVIYLHTVFSFSMRTDFFATKAWFIFEPFAAFSKTSIALFFMISGFLVISKNRTIKDNLTIVKNRIIIPLVSFTLIISLFQIYKLKMPLFSGLLQQLFGDLSKFPNNWLWFLSVLLFLYLLNPLWQLIFNQEKNKEIAIFLTKFFFIFTVITISIKFLTNNLNYFNTFTIWLAFLFYYLYGALVKNNWIDVNHKKLNLLLILIGLLGEIVGDYFVIYSKVNSLGFFSTSYFMDYMNFPVILMAIGIFNLLISQDSQKFFENVIKGKILKIIQVLADLSFGIYLIHPIVVSILSDILGASIDNVKINIYLYNLLYFVVVLTISVVIIFIIKKINKLKIIIGD